ncbi:protease inhibitor I42 family protein [Bradyrhizobium sediminis]|uniref:Protease inhibitor I42 family protein n=1 Tax=Bradyrhizobium sediminis TaxID=2840469 RepID=A0A975P1X8_9BRAD|nr:protease inhibitor I42 family protein [Bradyrhizobium sediminis]QWG24654.1 protease inhibitor I42 family protein [Bradyrhizobium sediminis]
MTRAPLACLLLAAAMLAATATEADAADQTLQLTVGQQATVELEENPSTGYRWTIDAKSGVNASILRISDRGFSQNADGKRLLGAPGIHRWSIAATSAGSASVTFVYQRSWEATSVRRHQVTVQAVAR